ncbi:MAG: hypothetical protein JWO15_3085 [Sphingomonadales bacterium]|nr:hypothetical protein [Sphingomonadales bacterium]
MSVHPVPTQLPVTAVFAASLALGAFLLSLIDPRGDMTIATGVMVAAGSGSVAALNYRWITLMAAVGLMLRALSLAAAWSTGGAGAILMLLPPILLLVAATMPRPIAGVRLPVWCWAVFPVAAAALIVTTQRASPGSASWFLLLPMGAILASFVGFTATRHINGEDMIGNTRHALGERQWLTETARYLLLGRISGGLSHELSQSLNVITMANGHLGYILGRAGIEEPHGQQLTERVRRIAGNAESAAQVLGQFRWFGQDGGREGEDLTVGSALENAVSATRAAARKSGVPIGVRGDALTYALPLRHGTIEMLATVALLEILQMLSMLPVDDAPPEGIMLEATLTATHIEISVLCAGAGRTRAAASDDIARATYELASKLAWSCRCELRRNNRRNDPVRFILRLNRDMV